MPGSREDEVERLCHAALERHQSDRAAFLASACGGDETLRREVESLLEHEGAVEQFIHVPALQILTDRKQPTDGEQSSNVDESGASGRVRITAGALFGPYEVLSVIGAGGMGEVYRARDPKLNRDVALKVLPHRFSHDPERLARFEREAQVLASLNHPNIAVIHGVEQNDGVRALVLELVEGLTLADLIAQGPIPFEETLTIARQVAEALQAAHDHGVIHRDLKPANIKVRPDGTVKVLDFGLAKVLDDQRSEISPRSPVIRNSGLGVLLGTAAYMSPEQVKGRSADRQSDVWAFGCLLFEMLAGRAAFLGHSAGEILGGVLTSEPDWQLVADRPEAIWRLLRRCLQKDPRKRLRDIGDARIEIDELRDQSLGMPPTPITASLRSYERPAWLQRLAWLSGLLLATTVALATWTIWRSGAQAQEVRLEVTTPPTTNPQSIAISPDGRMLVFVATSEGKSRLWLRRLDDPKLRVLPGTDNANLPFWSPDGRSLGFSVESHLKRIDLDSGAVQTVAPYKSMLGGAWLQDGTILATANLAAPLVRIAPGGGAVRPVTQVTARAFGHRSPQMLPDGRHFLCFAGGADAGIHVGRLGESTTRKILDATAAVYSPTGHLLFVRQGNLFSQPFDVMRLEVTGAPTLIAQNIVPGPIEGVAALAVSAAGPIVYRTGGAEPRRQLMWVDRSGKPLDVLSRIDQMGGLATSLSDNEAYVAWTRGTDLWLFEFARGVSTRLTLEQSVDLAPVWAPDGRRIVYGAYNDGEFDLFMKSVKGSSAGERLLRAPGAQFPDDWSPDGQVLLFTSSSSEGENMSPSEVWALPLDGQRRAFPVVRTAGVAANAEFSPSGTWVAFQLYESDRFEVYVQPFPQGDKVRISTDGGVQPRWRDDGKELFYIGADNRLMAVSIDLESVKTPTVGPPVPLFMPFWSLVPHHPTIKNYIVSRDGRRFLVDVLRETTSSVTVLLNWQPEG